MIQQSLLAAPDAAASALAGAGRPAAALRRLLELDAALLLGAGRLRSDSATRLMCMLTRFGNAETWILLGLALLAAGGAAGRSGLRLAAASLGSTLATQLLKRTCRRRRPSLRLHGFSALCENPDLFSFPSGHASAAVAVAVALVGQGAFLGPLALALAAGISVSRVYVGAHYPLDVGAGALLGALCGLATRVALGG